MTDEKITEQPSQPESVFDGTPNITYLSGDRDGSVSPRTVMADFINDAEDLECVVIVALSKDEGVMIGHSHGSNLEKLGLVDLAKSHLRDRMRS